jgi:hypothetical protein
LIIFISKFDRANRGPSTPRQRQNDVVVLIAECVNDTTQHDYVVLCSALAQTRWLFLGSVKFAKVLGNSRAKKRGFWEIQNNSQNPEPKKSRTQKESGRPELFPGLVTGQLIHQQKFHYHY